jgi:hypothetical protein
MINSLKKIIKKGFSDRLTIMVVPHGTAKPRQASLSLAFLAFSLVGWLGLTGWSAYIAAQHVDYWHSKMMNQVLTLKMAYLDWQVHQFSEKIDQVKEVELRLQDLLRMGSRKAIIQGDGSWSEPAAQGGPTLEESQHLRQLLETGVAKVSWSDIQKELDDLNQTYQARITGYRQIEGWVKNERRLFRATPTGWPITGPVTSHFGLRTDLFTGMMEFHTGIDIGADWGKPIRATADGVVIKSGWEEGYGKLVIINHGFGYSSLYGHMSEILVKEGDTICRNQIIGRIGATGRATGPHCHYEVWRFGKTVNPYSYMVVDNTDTPQMAQNTNARQ